MRLKWVKLCLVNFNRIFFHLFNQCKFDKLDVVLSSRFIIHSEQRAQDLTVDMS